MNLSKSRYVNYCQCPKKMWLDVYTPDVAGTDAALEARLADGNKVGEYAHQLFPDFIDATVLDEDGTVNNTKMLEKTRQLLETGTRVIAEAAFSYDGSYCAVDLFRNITGNMYEINEVKSVTCNPDDEKSRWEVVSKYLPDVGYQKYVISKLGYAVAEVNIICFNSNYTVPKSGIINPNELFCVLPVNQYLTHDYLMEVENNIAEAKFTIDSDTEIDIPIGHYCKKPFDCPFMKYCMQQAGITYPSVFNLYRSQWKKKLDFFNKGIVSFNDVKSNAASQIKSTIQKLQIECVTENKEHVDKRGIITFLDSLSYPLYFLDFETMNEAIPQYPGTKAYQQVPFQYSLHIKENEDSTELIHKEFLGNPDEDPRRALAVRLCEDIPVNVCVMAYNMAFERGRIAELAEMYPDLREHLLCIMNNIVDLIIPFNSGYYYTPAMKDSFSIKSVLPALFPDSEELNYHNLNESVQNGAMAMAAFPAMKSMNESERAAMRKNLLAYCRLDTLAMVRVLEKLYEVANR